jgi:hypothetical protein
MADGSQGAGVTLSSLQPDPIKVVTDHGTEIVLCPLTRGDLNYLADLLQKDLPPQHFVKEFLSHKVVSDGAAFDDTSGDGLSLADEDPFEGFVERARTTLEDYVADFLRPGTIAATRVQAQFGRAGASAARLQTGFQDMIDGMQLSVDRVVAELTRQFGSADFERMNRMATEPIRSAVEAANRLAANLGRLLGAEALTDVLAAPWFLELQQAAEKAKRGLSTLESAGYGHSGLLWPIHVLIELAEVNPDQRDSLIASLALELTSSDNFRDELQSAVNSSEPGSRRWPAVREALENHIERRYYASIATGIPQIEGMLNDRLPLASGQVVQDGTRFYRMLDGGKRDELSGAARKVKVLSLDSAIAKAITDLFLPNRNSIVHGVNPAYADPQLSARVLLLLRLLAEVEIMDGPAGPARQHGRETGRLSGE